MSYLIFTAIVLVIILLAFLIKLVIDLSGLLKSLDNFVRVTQTELEPTIKEIKVTLENINNISLSITNQVNSLNIGVKKGVNNIKDVSAVLAGKTRVFGSLLKDGIITGLHYLISSKRK
jgi:predicted PurR-regulated permease PerM